MDTLRPILAAMLLASLLTTSSAAATPTEADRATARSLAYEAHDALTHKRYAIAADRFARADALIHAPTLLLGLARAQVGLGKLTAAQQTYTRILNEGIPTGSPAVFKQAVLDARKEAKKLEARIPSLMIAIKGPRTSSVTLDGAPLPSTALDARLPLDPGSHVIRAASEGFEPREVSVTMAEGKQDSVTLELKPTQQRTAGASGPSSPSGSAPGGAPQDAGGDTTSLRRTLGIVGLGVGGAGLVLSGVTGVLAIAERNSFKDQCLGYVCPSELKDKVSTYRTLGALSTVGFFVGGACIAAGAILFVTLPPSKPAAKPRIMPVLGVGHLGIEGAF